MLSEDKCPYASGVESSLAERCRRTHGRIPRFNKYGPRTRQTKMTGQGKPEEMLHKSDVNFHKGVTQGLSEPTWVSVPRCCALFFLINTLLVSLLYVCVGILFCKVEGPRPGHGPLV